jgi:hypothetical protein
MNPYEIQVTKRNLELEQHIAELERENERLRPVVEWAARGPCICHPANKAQGMECLKDAADVALAPEGE